MDGVDKGYYEIIRVIGFAHILNDPLFHHGRNAGAVGGDGFYPAVRKIFYVIESGDIDSADLAGVEKKLLFAQSPGLGVLVAATDLREHLFPFS